MNQVLAFTHRSGDADEPFGQAELLSQYIKETQAVYCNGYIRHHAATAEFPGHETSPRVLPRVPKLVHTLMLFASHHTSNLMISHILLFLTTLKNQLRLLSAGWAEEGTFPRTGSNNSSGWEESGRLQTGSRWPRHMNQPPPIPQSQSEPNAKIRKKQYFLLIQNHLQPDTAILLLGATHTTVQI